MGQGTSGMSSDVLTAIGDVMLNLSAAWFGAALVAPPFFDFSSPAAILLLAANIMAGIFALASGVKLRRLASKYSSP